ncbi:DUF4097 family beta strand repeat-containing protein [Bacillus massiliigorillae]|uniref:DUF4097 family beta strand repeat-containing protein n=1 Tax=Bacillus massiliigorillae TaxID=1243664 RepID=UPI00039C728A|nr:DUF4097 family beta strand repeat-containing protein [Bacillus massiliigorillae]
MKKSKLIPIIAGCMIVIGLILTAIGFALGAKFSIVTTNDGFKVIDFKDMRVESKDLSPFTSISADFRDADVEIIPSNEYKIEIRSHKELKKEFTYKVTNNKLIIESKGSLKSNFGLFNLSFGGIPQTTIKVYVPKNTSFDNIDIVNDFGDIHLDGINSNSLQIKTQDGDLLINNIRTNSFEIKNNFGDIDANSITAKELTIKMNDGDLEFNSVKANSTAITNRFGDISLSDFTSEGLNIQSNDGDIEVQGLLLGTSEISSTFGDVDVQASNKESELSYTIKSSFGDIMVNNNEFESNATHQVNSSHKLDIKAKDGDVSLQF